MNLKQTSCGLSIVGFALRHCIGGIFPLCQWVGEIDRRKVIKRKATKYERAHSAPSHTSSFDNQYLDKEYIYIIRHCYKNIYLVKIFSRIIDDFLYKLLVSIDICGKEMSKN